MNIGHARRGTHARFEVGDGFVQQFLQTGVHLRLRLEFGIGVIDDVGGFGVGDIAPNRRGRPQCVGFHDLGDALQKSVVGRGGFGVHQFGLGDYALIHKLPDIVERRARHVVVVNVLILTVGTREISRPHPGYAGNVTFLHRYIAEFSSR